MLNNEPEIVREAEALWKEEPERLPDAPRTMRAFRKLVKIQYF
jgi:hypothetical protein